MKAKHKYHNGVQCVARGRAAIITNQIKGDYFIPKYRVDFTDQWKAAVPFAIVFEDDIVIKKGQS